MLGGFVATGKKAIAAVKSKAGTTEILQQLAKGVDPAELGLTSPEDLEQQIRDFVRQQETELLGPLQSDVETPLNRLSQGLTGFQAQRGLAFGGAAQALRQTDPLSQIQKLGGIGLSQLGPGAGGITQENQAQMGSTPELFTPDINRLMGLQRFMRGIPQIMQASQQQGRFNVFNPPPGYTSLF
jgi:hypothetical protein